MERQLMQTEKLLSAIHKKAAIPFNCLKRTAAFCYNVFKSFESFQKEITSNAPKLLQYPDPCRYT